MSERITKANLDHLLKQINLRAGSEDWEWRKREDGKGLTSNVGHYVLDWAYGGVALERFCSDGGGVCTIISRCTRRELWYRMRAYLDGMREGGAE